MKRILFPIFACLLLVNISYSQSYNVINYQGSLRNPDGSPLADREISLRLTIVESIQNGNSLYYEVRKITTNSVGLYSVAVGSEGAESVGGISLSDINWGSGSKFLRVELDPNAQNDFLVSNTIQLSAVPYSMYASQGGTSGFNYWKQMSGNEQKSYDDYFNFIKQATAMVPQIKVISSSYTVTKADVGVLFWIDGSSAVSINVAPDLPAGFNCKFLQKHFSEIATTFNGMKNFQNSYTLAGQFAEASLVVPEEGYAVLKGQLKP